MFEMWQILPQGQIPGVVLLGNHQGKGKHSRG